MEWLIRRREHVSMAAIGPRRRRNRPGAPLQRRGTGPVIFCPLNVTTQDQPIRAARSIPAEGEARLAPTSGAHALIDTHIHLDELEDLDASLAEAREVGVTDLIGMGVDGPTSRQVVEWSHSKPGVWAAVGHHPLNQSGPDLDLLRALAAGPRVVAIGEVGLDHEDEHRGPHDAQADWFHGCCELALQLDLPVCVHTRGCEEQVLDALRS